MDSKLKQRLVGATVLIAAGVIFLPMLLDGPVERPEAGHESAVPLIVPDAPEPRPREPATVQPETAPEPEPEPELEPGAMPDATPAPAPDAEGWVLQLGSFSRRRNADALAGSMRERGFDDAFVQEVEVENGVMYRVRIGPYPERARAEALLERVREASGERAVVVSHP